MKRSAGSRRLLPISLIAGALVASVVSAIGGGGCASDKKPASTQPTSMSQRQDAALRDPFGYKPDMSRDVSGGDIGHLDRDGLKKDLNNVFNP